MKGLNELIQAGLFGRGLIAVDHPILVARYNACLQDMGLKTTALPKFQIDRMGWSPEIADEQNNSYYLSHGEANPLAIILTPDQEKSPIYFPMHSFDWKIMEQWFSLNQSQITDLTKDSAIWLDLDQEVSLYRFPSDLTMVSEVIVRAYSPDKLMDRAKSQKDLVFRWLNEPKACLDTALINELLSTAVNDGDLRKRNFIIRKMQYSDVADFYSRVFGGVYVLRSCNHEPLVLTCDESKVGEGVRLADRAILDTLEEYGYIKADLSWWKDHMHRLKIIAESFLVEVLDIKEPALSFDDVSDVLKRQLVNKYKDDLAIYFEFDELYNTLKRGELPKSKSSINIYLLHPSDELTPSSQEVIWQLLTYIRGGRFVPLMYRYQKETFIEAYTQKWGNPRRTWSLAKIRNYYDAIMRKASSS